jgi:hypothetical protein
MSAAQRTVVSPPESIDWLPLQVEDDHGPDPSTPEGIERAGTDPLWVGDATGVQASAVTSSGTTVSGAKVILIQPGVLATDADEPQASGVIQPGRSTSPVLTWTR